MNIAIIAQNRKKELMVQFCIAYCGLLAKHNLCAIVQSLDNGINAHLRNDMGGSLDLLTGDQHPLDAPPVLGGRVNGLHKAPPWLSFSVPL